MSPVLSVGVAADDLAARFCAELPPREAIDRVLDEADAAVAHRGVDAAGVYAGGGDEHAVVGTAVADASRVEPAPVAGILGVVRGLDGVKHRETNDPDSPLITTAAADGSGSDVPVLFAGLEVLEDVRLIGKGVGILEDAAVAVVLDGVIGPGVVIGTVVGEDAVTGVILDCPRLRSGKCSHL